MSELITPITPITCHGAYDGRFAKDETVALYPNGKFVCPAYDSVNHCCGHWKRVPTNSLGLAAHGLETVQTDLGPAAVCKVEVQLEEYQTITIFSDSKNLLP